MPRIVLVEDDGREVFSGDLSRANFELIAALIKRNGGVIRVAAAGLRLARDLGLLAPPPPPRGRRAAQVVYLPPPRKRGRA